MVTELSDSIVEWHRVVSERRVDVSRIESEKSASGFEFPAFLTLRAIWPLKISHSSDIDDKKWMSPQLQACLQESTKFLKESQDWQAYLKHLDPRKTTGLGKASVNFQGSFSIARYCQGLSFIQEKIDFKWDELPPKL